MKINIKESTPWPHPDWADLLDWGLGNKKEVWEATKYCSLSTQYDILLPLWHEAGRPTEGFESALWTEEESTK